MKPFESTALRYDGKLWVLDQRKLPEGESWLDITNPDDAITAIRSLAVRGAPLIGVTAAACLGALGFREDFKSVAARLRAARPTAINLAWAVDRMMSCYDSGADVCFEAFSIFEEDRLLCNRISRYGANLIEDGCRIVTHCNAGALATAGVGTALGVLKEAHAQGKNIHVYVDETRPLLQGARLTTWELRKANIPYTLICDNMAASLMRQKKINAAIVGADRIAANGDFANKIGTYSLAVNCRHHGIPLWVAAPFSTIDWRCKGANDIPIEQRDPNEIARDEECWNPAFDVTDAFLVDRFILDHGVFNPEEFCCLDRVRLPSAYL